MLMGQCQSCSDKKVVKDFVFYTHFFKGSKTFMGSSSNILLFFKRLIKDLRQNICILEK